LRLWLPVPALRVVGVIAPAAPKHAPSCDADKFASKLLSGCLWQP
jgi:hypothetical protein